MSLTNSEFNKDNQNLCSSQEKREQYGEIFTPYSLIERMFGMLTNDAFTNPNAIWLDPGAGTGFFSVYLFWRLDTGLANIISCKDERRKHIITKMIYMVELQEENVSVLTSLFGINANIYNEDYLSTKSFTSMNFDYIIGNPPYNKNGIKKVPTNTRKNKKQDGSTLWFDFIKKSVSLLKDDGKLLMIVPSLWMKPDKAGAYDFITQHRIMKIVCMNNTETNRVFGGAAQTPTCLLLMERSPSRKSCELYDADRNEYIAYTLRPKYPIPVFGVSIVNRFVDAVNTYGGMPVKKTNMPGKNVNLSETKGGKFIYANIRTARLDGLKPKLHINYSDSPLGFDGETKLVLPHKMYGFPFLDSKGEYGISNRDNYVIDRYNEEELCIIKEFLSTKTALYIYEATRYRMKYLEKYAFRFLPDVTKIAGLLAKRPITDETIASYFGLDAFDSTHIERLHKKTYDFEYSKL
jgi:tRNA1(Val) A37 N6-methylase TrmN6